MCVKAELCQAKQREAEHRVVITECSSAQFPTWIFNFGPYGQLNAVRENSSIKLKYATFSCFRGQRFIQCDCECKSIRTLRNVLLYLFCEAEGSVSYR